MTFPRPVSFFDAVKFARDEFAQRTVVYWPRLIVAYAEQVARGEALRFAMEIYAQIAERRGNEYVVRLLRELNGMIIYEDAFSSLSVHERSDAIWSDNSDRSRIKRGSTRLFNALSHLIADALDDYEVQLTRALSMVIGEDSKNPIEVDFEFVVSSFVRTYAESANYNGDV